MNAAAPLPDPNGAPRARGITAGLRAAFIAYARWLDSISWKRFFGLSILILVASGILSHLPPFNIEFGGRTITEVIDAPSPPVPPRKRNRSAPGRTDEDRRGSFELNIGKDGVQIKRSPPSESASAASTPGPATSSPSVGPDLTGVPVPPTPPTPPGPRRERRQSSGSDASDKAQAAVERAMDKAEADLEKALAKMRSRTQREDISAEIEAAVEQAMEQAESDIEEALSNVRTRIRRERGFRLGDYLPPFTFLLIVLSLVTKVMAAGRFKAEAKAVVATEMAESEALKRQVVEARMAAMQAQVEPHFLFNTLASIDHLIETDPKRASQMQKNLIALLRASMPTMREGHPAAHNLGREMAVIRPYLEILKVRMEDRLQTDVDVPEGLLSAEFPSMMIQSLVENAIKHGLEPKAEGGKLTVRAEIVHGKLAVTVADTGLGFGKAATAGTGTGLNNIRERLKLLYGSRAAMTVTENEPSGTVVTLSVPYQSQAHAEATS